MDDQSGLGSMRHWGYFEQPPPATKRSLGLQLMSPLPNPQPSMQLDRNTKPFFTNGGFGFLRRECPIPQPSMPLDNTKPLLSNGGGLQASVPLDFVRDSGWIHHGRDINGSNSKILHILQSNHTHQPNYNVLPDPPAPLPLPPPPKTEKSQVTEEAPSQNGSSSKKRRSKRRTQKSPNPKKPKKTATPKDRKPVGKSRKTAAGKSTAIVVSGINLDISGIPTPVCTCTGKARQCYRWGIGGWQSACCTTSISMHPLPMSTKRRGARISGRKMSRSAFTKVLEKIAGEGYNLSNPIDLKSHWAKHGTNKFVTIR